MIAVTEAICANSYIRDIKLINMPNQMDEFAQYSWIHLIETKMKTIESFSFFIDPTDADYLKA